MREGVCLFVMIYTSCTYFLKESSLGEFLALSSYPQSTGFGTWLFFVSSLMGTHSRTKWDVLFLVSV